MKPTHIATHRYSGSKYYLLEDRVGLVKYAYARGEEPDIYLWNKTDRARIADFRTDIWDIKKITRFKGNK